MNELSKECGWFSMSLCLSYVCALTYVLCALYLLQKSLMSLCPLCPPHIAEPKALYIALFVIYYCIMESY